jgi:hypothetical protein
MSETINVNLEKCDCGHAAWVERGHISYQHDAHCPAVPIPLSCPIPRSVTLTVVLSPGCYCERLGIGADPHHVPNCPARPIRVSCSISGATWAESDVG